jgi:hypothetical protein
VGEDASKELLSKCRSKHPVKITPVIKYWKDNILSHLSLSLYTIHANTNTQRNTIPSEKGGCLDIKKGFFGGIRASTWCNGRGKLRVRFELYDIGRSVQFVSDCILLKVGCRFDPQYRDSSAP